MTFQESVKTVLSKFATFSGRATRSEYWWYILAVSLLGAALAVIEGAVIAPMLGFEPFAEEAGQPLRMVAGLILFLPTLAVTVRRLHDTDHSGWWYLLVVIPIIGILVLLYWYVKPGTEGPNQFG